MIFKSDIIRGCPVTLRIAPAILGHVLNINNEFFFVEGEQKVNLCTDCRLKAQSMGSDYIKYKTNFGGCPLYRKEEGHFSLFEFRVDN